MENSNLYWLTNKNSAKEILLDQIDEDKFRVLEFGELKPILCGGNLIDNSIAEILQKYVPEQITSIKNIIIWRKSTNETWDNYSQIEIKNHLDLENFKNAEHEGYKMYQLFYDSIYISQSLKDKFISECDKIIDLSFVNEFPRYA